MSRLPPLRIGDITIDPPILQGAMGAYISLHNLASAVSNEGALGVITSVGLGEYADLYQDLSYEERSDRSLKDIIAETRKRTSRPFGVNIMYALTNHDRLVRVCVDEKVPIIVSGAGLPLKLPSLVSGSTSKMIPIVSSGKAADLICRTWRKRFNIYPDAFIVEGPLAGGHLGYSYEELENINNISLEKIFTDVKKAVHGHSERIPIIVGGGIFSGSDIARFLKIGAKGVQMATRFIATFECDASNALKNIATSIELPVCNGEGILSIPTQSVSLILMSFPRPLIKKLSGLIMTGLPPMLVSLTLINSVSPLMVSSSGESMNAE